MTNQIKNLAVNAANDIADLFSVGFFDDQMTDTVAEIVEQYLKQITDEYSTQGVDK
jgi:hypothetical protein